MRNLFGLLIGLFLLMAAPAVYGQIGHGTSDPSKASVVEMLSSSKGLLIPRVALESLDSFDPIKGELSTTVDKVNSLLVYNTAISGTAPNNVTPGYYYWTVSPARWNRLLADSDAAALALVGDVTGTPGNNTVTRIQNNPVAAITPTDNQVLTWNGTSWIPMTPAPAPRFFYMPAVVFDTRNLGTGLTRDLYQDYVNQFQGAASYAIAHGAGTFDPMTYTGGLVRSGVGTPEEAPVTIPVYAKGELFYYITYYDQDVFENLSINENGVLTYSIKGNVQETSYMNILFVIK